MSKATPDIAKKVVFVVDDDESVREAIRSMMEIEGFEVYAYSNGGDLLNETSLPEFGCLIVDYHMPRMNGLELVSALRDRGVSTPAILITGSPTKHVCDRAAAVAVLVVGKLQLGSHLLDCVRDAVAKQASLSWGSR